MRETRDGYVAWSAPLGEEEGKRAQAEDGAAGRVEVWALSDHRFQKHSESDPVWQRGSERWGRYTL
ncbi:MAG: hypothetical protein JWO17_188 [Actinomycetia bacterium]|nr:hypothetical protein [Actinomycetes bacterium]